MHEALTRVHAFRYTIQEHFSFFLTSLCNCQKQSFVARSSRAHRLPPAPSTPTISKPEPRARASPAMQAVSMNIAAAARAGAAGARAAAAPRPTSIAEAAPASSPTALGGAKTESGGASIAASPFDKSTQQVPIIDHIHFHSCEVVDTTEVPLVTSPLVMYKVSVKLNNHRRSMKNLVSGEP